VQELLAAARRGVRRLTPAEAVEAAARGALLVDTRPVEQRHLQGEVPGALVIERNVLEWRLDPASPWRIPEVTGHDQQMIVLCAEGYSSSFAAASLRALGISGATDVIDGIVGWNAAGLPLNPPSPETPASLR